MSDTRQHRRRSKGQLPAAVVGEEGIRLAEIRCPWDDAIWLHVTAGFFKVKEQIPAILTWLGLAA